MAVRVQEDILAVEDDSSTHGSADATSSPATLRSRTLSVTGMLETSTCRVAADADIETQRSMRFSQSVASLKNFEDVVTTSIKATFTSLNADIPDASKIEMDEQDDLQGPHSVVVKRIISRLTDLNVHYNSEDLSELISIARGKLAEQHSRIGIFGKLKAGKSTLLNALSRSEFFPTDPSCPETSIIVSVHHDNTYHQGLCEEGAGCTTKYELKCPLLHVDNEVRAGKSYEIVDILKSINKDCRGQNTSFREYSSYHITSNMPMLAEKLILQDTPGFGEARNLTVKHVTTHALYSCSAYIYILDSSKLGDQLDVDALLLLYKKDPSIFEDGRILVVANHIDCTFQRQAGSRGRTSAAAQQTLVNIHEKIETTLNLNLSTDFIVPCSAYWAWVARVLPYEDAEYDLTEWKNRFLRVFSLTNSLVPDTVKFIEEASQVDQIENWLQTVLLNQEAVHKKAIISDVIHCLDTSMELCSKELQCKLQSAEEYISEMEVKRTTWNELMDLMNDMYSIAESISAEIDMAYDEDIEIHINHLRHMAEEQLEHFREVTCSKCTPSSHDDGPQEEDRESHKEAPHGDDTYSVNTPDASLSHQEEVQLPSSIGDRNLSNCYSLNDFKKDLLKFITRIENSLISHINTIKFAHITNTIPLQEFGQNETLLTTLASVILHYKANTRSSGGGSFVYNQPRHDIILQENPLALEQLRELTEIEALRLSWWTRVKLWFKTRVRSSSKDSRQTHPMTQSDINSAMAFFKDSKCLDDCEMYLKTKVKPQIVQCYYTAYHNLVTSRLNDFEETTFHLIENKVETLEKKVKGVLEQCKDTKAQLEYLVICKRHLSLEKEGIILDTSYFTNRKRNMTDMMTIEQDVSNSKSM